MMLTRATFLRAALLVCSALPVMAQNAAPAAGARIPRLSDGHPNLNGIWQNISTANIDLLDHMSKASPVMEMGAYGAEPGGPGVVEGGVIPYKPEAEAKKKENAANRMARDPEVRCYLPGVPRATYMPYPFQIFQSTKAIAIAYQYDGAFRNIALKDPGPAPIDTWMGQSWGRWEGDTFVVDVTGLDERTWLSRAGDHHSDALHVVERYTMVSPTQINYEATIDDSKVYTKPWKISLPLFKHTEKNARMMDFKCVEFVEDLMYGQFSKKPSK